MKCLLVAGAVLAALTCVTIVQLPVLASGYDFSGCFVGHRTAFEFTGQPGITVEWAVVDSSDSDVFRSTAVSDENGYAKSEYWKPIAEGRHRLTVLESGVEVESREIVVKLPHTLQAPYVEDFSKPVEWCASVWDSAGKIRTSTSRDNYLWWSGCPIVASEFSLGVEVSFTRHTAGGAGLVFGLSEDLRSFYAVGVDAQGYLMIVKSSEGHLTTIMNRTPCKYIKQGLHTTNLVEVEVKGSVARISLNGHDFVTLKETIPPGQVGIALLNIQGGITAYYDNFSLAMVGQAAPSQAQPPLSTDEAPGPRD